MKNNLGKIWLNFEIVTEIFRSVFRNCGCSYLTNKGLLHVAACAECQVPLAWHSAARCTIDIVFLVSASSYRLLAGLRNFHYLDPPTLPSVPFHFSSSGIRCRVSCTLHTRITHVCFPFCVLFGVNFILLQYPFRLRSFQFYPLAVPFVSSASVLPILPVCSDQYRSIHVQLRCTFLECFSAFVAPLIVRLCLRFLFRLFHQLQYIRLQVPSDYRSSVFDPSRL